MTTKPHGQKSHGQESHSQEQSSDKRQKGNLGQQEARLEKEKKSELSNMGKTREQTDLKREDKSHTR
jgi:hypothetical protein